MTINTELLAQLGLVEGGDAITEAEFNTRVNTVYRRKWHSALRHRVKIDPTTAQLETEWLTNMAPTLAEAFRILDFNGALAALKQAQADIAEATLLLNGADPWTETRVLEGRFDENGEPLTETIEHEAAAALPLQIEQVTTADDGTETTAMIDNPARAEAEAAIVEAQAVVDATPQEVKDFDAG